VIVLDASALLAFLFSEAGHERVAAHLDRSCISAVNLSEVIGRFARDGHDTREVLQRINQSSIKTVPFLAEDAALAAALVPATLPLGLSLGDRACLALAASRKAPAWTADRAWARLDIGVSIEVIR
jgi:PIN domain nuclease of toxin-antitoxin system